MTFGDSELAKVSFMSFLISFIDNRPTPFISTHDEHESTFINIPLKIFKPDDVKMTTITMITLDFRIF
jgi:hypothetical protein